MQKCNNFSNYLVQKTEKTRKFMEEQEKQIIFAC